VYVTNTIL